MATSGATTAAATIVLPPRRRLTTQPVGRIVSGRVVSGIFNLYPSPRCQVQRHVSCYPGRQRKRPTSACDRNQGGAALLLAAGTATPHVGVGCLAQMLAEVSVQLDLSEKGTKQRQTTI